MARAAPDWSAADRAGHLGGARRARLREKFTAEIDKEIGKGKLTVAELEEEEHSLERLRRWHRELKIRDVFKAALAPDADRHLACCVRRLDEYTQLVFQALHGLDAESEN